MIAEAPVIPGKLLIGALSVKHHFDAAPLRLLEDAPLGKYASASVRLILIPSEPFGQAQSIFRSGKDIGRLAACVLNDRIDERLFVDTFLAIASTDAVDACPHGISVEKPGHEADDGRGVEPARKA